MTTDFEDIQFLYPASKTWLLQLARIFGKELTALYDRPRPEYGIKTCKLALDLAEPFRSGYIGVIVTGRSPDDALSKIQQRLSEIAIAPKNMLVVAPYMPTADNRRFRILPAYNNGLVIHNLGRRHGAYSYLARLTHG